MSPHSLKEKIVLPVLTTLLLCSACGDLPPDATGGGDEPLTSAIGYEHGISYKSFVFVPAGASNQTVRAAIQRQVRSSLGSLRELGIGVLDRDALSNLDPSTWKRTRLDVIKPDGSGAGQVDRVVFRYKDTALVKKGAKVKGTFKLPLLFGDYKARAKDLIPACSDDATADPGSLWYHFTPGRSACKKLMAAEDKAIWAAWPKLKDTSRQLPLVDRDRRFLPVLATLTTRDKPPVRYPEYDQLWGFKGNTRRTKLVAYVFFGVDKKVSDPADYGLVETMRFQDQLRRKFPGLRIFNTKPHAWLLDYYVDGKRLSNVTLDDVERWILHDTGYPKEVGSSASKRKALKEQVARRWGNRWIYWSLPLSVSDGRTTRNMELELRFYYGDEDGSHDIRKHARWRYLEAFWHGDIFAYTGHSHFGHGPLRPDGYASYNFPWRYQTMLVNSCLSLNYYNQDFLNMHPGKSKLLDIVVNGLPAYWKGMGGATAGYLTSLLDGAGKSWTDLLKAMRVDLPWHRQYDPMRAVNGELDNTYSPASRPLTVKALR